MRLLLAELRKVWGRRVTALCLAVLAGANLFLLYTGTKPGPNAASASAWRAVGRDLWGLPTTEQQTLINEKLDTAKGVYQVGQLLYDYALNAQYGYMSDPRTQYPELFEQYEQIYQDKSYTLYTENLSQEVAFLTTVKAELDTVAGYPQFLEDVQAKARQLSGISIFQNSQSGYDLENIGKTAAVYAGMGDVQINYAPQKGLYTALDYPFTDLILLAAMLLLASLLVRAERDSGMLAFVRTTPGGRLKTATAKLAALALSLLAVLVLLYGVNLAYCQLTFGLGPLDRNIQSVPALMRCTMRITVGQYLGLFLLAKWAGAFVMGLWVMLAALVCRRAATGWCAGLALPAAQWLIRQAIPATSRLNVVKYANLASLLRTNELLGNYRNLYWFDHPVPLPLVEWTAAALWCAALLAAFCLVFCWAALLAAPAFAGLRLGRPRTRPTTVWRQEARKLALGCGALAVLAVFAGYQAWQIAEAKSFIGAEEIYYQYYMTHISGPYDQEAYQWLQEQNEEFEPIRRMERALQTGEITVEEYQKQSSAFYGLDQKRQVFDRIVYGNLPYLKEHPGAQLVYESGWKELFCFTGDDDLRDTLVTGLLVSVCFAGLFAFEHRGGMKRVLMATPLGRKKTVIAKLLSSGAAAILLWALVGLPRLIVVLRDYGLPAPLAPAMSLYEYLHLPGWLSLAGILLLAGITRLSAVLCMASITLWLSETLGSALSSIFLSALGFCLPPLLALSGLWPLRWISFYPLFHTAELLRRPADGVACFIILILSNIVSWLCIDRLFSSWK
ncbi:hypothetical protein [Candidatus Allofournierella merdavium]|uniref:hypothetical protein n=1 Tax=Candidatus Allofournierella merdavium TaxID=2838593 RepID=UPI00374F1B8D